MTDAPPPALKEAVLRDRAGAVLGRVPASWDREIILMVERVGEAKYLQLIYADEQTNSLELPVQTVFPGEVQNFGKLEARRVQG